MDVSEVKNTDTIFMHSEENKNSIFSLVLQRATAERAIPSLRVSSFFIEGFRKPPINVSLKVQLISPNDFHGVSRGRQELPSLGSQSPSASDSEWSEAIYRKTRARTHSRRVTVRLLRS